MVVEAVDRLTGRDASASTTVSGWRQMMPTKGAFRRERAYCPCCYAEWGSPRANSADGEQGSLPLYEPLLWQFQAVGVCVEHGVRLRMSCPDPACGARRGALAAWAQPGYCSCGNFLGESAIAVIARDGRPTAAELEWGAFVTEALSDLITSQPGPPTARDVTIAQAVRLAVARTHDGTFTPFAEVRRSRAAHVVAAAPLAGRAVRAPGGGPPRGAGRRCSRPLRLSGRGRPSRKTTRLIVENAAMAVVIAEREADVDRGPRR